VCFLPAAGDEMMTIAVFPSIHEDEDDEEDDDDDEEVITSW